MKNEQSHFRKLILLLSLILGLFATMQFSSVNDSWFRNQPPNVNQANHSDGRQNQQIQLPVEEIEKPKIEKVEKATFDKPSVARVLSFQDHLAIQAELRLQSDVRYDGSYRKIAYPMGDVPENIGVCTDVVIRSFRGLGIDLQQRVHEDMKRNFRSYPKKWKLSKPDSNIDHRRVPNLMTYFKRAGASLAITDNPLDYFAGNIVAWDLSDGKGKGKGKGLVHIGIVSNYVSEFTSNPLIIHNIGAGPQMNDMLFDYKIIGHYKYCDKKIPKYTLRSSNVLQTN